MRMTPLFFYVKFWALVFPLDEYFIPLVLCTYLRITGIKMDLENKVDLFFLLLFFTFMERYSWMTMSGCQFLWNQHPALFM